MAADPNRWRWSTDELPDDAATVWIRPIVITAKPAPATFDSANNLFLVSVSSATIPYAAYIVPQWRARTP